MRQFSHNGPAGFLKCAISSAEQHIVHAPQDFPGAAAILPSRATAPITESERADRMSLSPFRREREADLHARVESDARLAVRRGLKRAPHRQRKERSDG